MPACSPGYDILGGICSSFAPSVLPRNSSSIAWIAAPIIIGLLILGLVVLILWVWKYKNGTYNRWKKTVLSWKNGKADSTSKDSARMVELTEENQRLRAHIESLTSGQSSGHPGSSGIAGVPSPGITFAQSNLPTIASLPKIRRGPSGGVHGSSLPPIDSTPPGSAQGDKDQGTTGTGEPAAFGTHPAQQSQFIEHSAALPEGSGTAQNSSRRGSDGEYGVAQTAPGPSQSAAPPYMPAASGPTPNYGMPFVPPSLPNSQGPTLFQRSMFGGNKVNPAPPVFGPPRVLRPSQTQLLPPGSEDADSSV